MNIKPKLENAKKGFKYYIEPSMLAMFQQWTVEQRIDWVFETAELVLEHQTPKQREAMERIKNGVNYE